VTPEVAPAVTPVVIEGVVVDAPLTKRGGVPFKKGDDPRRQLGRAKGSKNRVTLLRLDLEEELRGELKKEGMKVLRTAIKLAKAGDPKVIKVLLDKMLASPKGDDPDNAKDSEVTVVIQNLTHGDQKTAVIAGSQAKTVVPQESP